MLIKNDHLCMSRQRPRFFCSYRLWHPAGQLRHELHGGVDHDAPCLRCEEGECRVVRRVGRVVIAVHRQNDLYTAHHACLTRSELEDPRRALFTGERPEPSLEVLKAGGLLGIK